MNKDKTPPECKPGDFPFPLSTGRGESEYLTWLRNHSNYMATRGFLDYLRVAGVLVRGILINFLDLLPWLLLLSVAVAWFYRPFFQSKNPIKNLSGDVLNYQFGSGPKILDQGNDAEVTPWNIRFWFTENHADYTKLTVALDRDFRDSDQGGGKLGIQFSGTPEGNPEVGSLSRDANNAILYQGPEEAQPVGFLYENETKNRLEIHFDENVSAEEITALVRHVNYEKTESGPPARVAFTLVTGNNVPFNAEVEVDANKAGTEKAMGAEPVPVDLWAALLADGKKLWTEFRRIFQTVLVEELREIQKRRRNCVSASAMVIPGDGAAEREVLEAAFASDLVGLGFSGGGIRSATINLGIAQVLHGSGIFDRVDYMSTVSGGGYLGSSISALMRYRESPFSIFAGKASVSSQNGNQVVTVENNEGTATYEYTEEAELHDKLKSAGGKPVKVGRGQALLEDAHRSGNSDYGRMFNWRIRPTAFLREMLSKLDETHQWVNLSDGGHIENLAGMELLRRRCRFIILGDGEADPDHSFNGLATLVRYARIDLDIAIDIDVEPIRLDKSAKTAGEGFRSSRHWAFGTINYPGGEKGYLLYLKSSFTGDEDVVIREYRERNPDFPHQSTADQFFDEGQFEAYRSLGQHIGEKAVEEMKAGNIPGDSPTAAFAAKFFGSAGTGNPADTKAGEGIADRKKIETPTPPQPQKPLSPLKLPSLQKPPPPQKSEDQ